MSMIPSDHCAALASPNIVNFLLSVVLVLGIFFSYVPQHHRIISRRSSEGLSPYFVLLGTIASTCTFANILVLPTSRADVACCREISGFACFAGLLGILQIGVIWACFTFILLFFLLFFPHASPLAPPSNLSATSHTPSFGTAIIITVICVIHGVITFVLSVLFIYSFPGQLQPWASFLGVLATVIASIQYFPQIYTTWRLKTVGSLSIPMMCVQTPGSFVFAGSLAARLGWMGWSTWGLFLWTGVLQGSLLCMSIWLETRDKSKNSNQEGSGAVSNGHVTAGESGRDVGPTEREDEQTPLLHA